MPILGTLLPLLGVGGAVGAALYFIGPAALIAFAKGLPTWVWIALGIVAALLFGWHIHTGWERANWNAGYNTAYAQGRAALDQTVTNYRAAAAEAKRADAANVARVKSKQSTITERMIDAYQAKLDASASRYDRLREQAAGYLAHSRSVATAGLPDTSEATCRAVAGTGCEAIPPLLKAAQDNTDQLVSLQAWVAAQAAVDVSGQR